MSASNYTELKLLDHLLGNTTFTQPASLYVALYTVTPSDTGGGTEVTGGSYARQTASFGAAASGACANDALITFSDMPSGSLVAFGILDASSGGNLLVWGPLTSQPVSVSAGQPVEFPIGSLIVTMD